MFPAILHYWAPFAGTRSNGAVPVLPDALMRRATRYVVPFSLREIEQRAGGLRRLGSVITTITQKCVMRCDETFGSC